MIAFTSSVGFLVVIGQVMPPMNYSQFPAGARVREQVLGSFAVHPGFIAALVLLLVLGFTICVDLFQCVTVSGSLQDVVPSWGLPRVSMVARCICPVHAHSEIQRRAQHSRSYAAVR